MIVSHRHKFIFIKTAKTAGTSVEIALSGVCGPDDVITPVLPEDEAIRTELGFLCPQNYRVPLRSYKRADVARAALRRKPVEFRNHLGARFIRDHINRSVLNSYFKFCVERNPWDKVLSLYYWLHPSEPRPSLGEFVDSTDARTIAGCDLYTIDSKVVVDGVYRFEDLPAMLADLSDWLKLDRPLRLPHANGGKRPHQQRYQDVLGEKERRTIEWVYAREIALFGYEW